MSSPKPVAYVIEFDFDLSTETVYAGIHKGAAGFAPTLETAQVFVTKEAAQTTLANAYGKEISELGTVKALYVGPLS